MALTVQLGSEAQQTMSLKECMQYAIDNSLKVKELSEENRKSQIERRDAILNAFTPNVNLTVVVDYGEGRLINPSTNTYINDATVIGDNYSLNGSLVLFNGFEAVNNMKIAKVAVEMGRSTKQWETDKICLSTMEAYYNTVYYTRLYNILNEQVATANRSFEKAKREYELGKSDRSKMLEAEGFLAEMEYRLADCEAQRNNALLTLKDLMFYPIEGDLQVDTAFVAAYAATDNNAAEIASYARENSDEVEVLNGQRNKAQLVLKTNRWQLLPKVELNAGLQTAHSVFVDYPDALPSYYDQMSENLQKYISLSINIPIFGKLGKYSKISRSKSDFQIADYQLKAKQKTVENEVYRAVDEAQSAERSMCQAKKSAELQGELFEINRKKYDHGTISYIEYSTAYNKYLESEAQYMSKLFTLNIKNSVLMYYQGISYINQL